MKIELIVKQNFTEYSDEYIDFARRKDACRDCSIYDNYKQVAQSEGNAKNPTFMFIGEALGKEEALAARPFVGRAGKRLRSELRKHRAFNRQNTLISNLIPCRPMDNKFPKDTDMFRLNRGGWSKCSGKSLVEHCRDTWLDKEIKIVKPKIIVTLGAQALRYVLGRTGITDNRGDWIFVNRYRAYAIPIFHPSYVLRCENSKDKYFIGDLFNKDIAMIANQWEDMCTDDRFHMSDEEWYLHQAVDKKLIR